MIREHLQEIYKVIDLAQERDAVPELLKKNGEECKDFFSLKEVGGTNPVYDLLDDKLREYLNSLSCEVLEAVQVIMWIGRGDCGCVKNNTILTGEKMYQEAKEEFGDVINKDKQNAIEYVLSKGRLGEFLEAGLEILNM